VHRRKKQHIILDVFSFIISTNAEGGINWNAEETADLQAFLNALVYEFPFLCVHLYLHLRLISWGRLASEH
jgi:hypothetical protein